MHLTNLKSPNDRFWNLTKSFWETINDRFVLNYNDKNKYYNLDW